VCVCYSVPIVRVHFTVVTDASGKLINSAGCNAGLLVVVLMMLVLFYLAVCILQ